MGVQINGDTGNVIATKGTFSGDVGIGGTLTYEDVTNIDAVGIITARSGIEIGARPGVAASISVDGNAIFSGIGTFSSIKTTGNISVATPAGTEAVIKVNEATTNNSFSLKQTDTQALIQTFASQPFNIRAQGGSGSTSYLAFWTRNDERLRIAADGKVGIGTTVPAADLHVSSGANTEIRIGDTTTTSSYGRIIYNNDADNADALVLEVDGGNAISGSNMRFRVDGSEKARIDDGGKLLIGLTTRRIFAPGHTSQLQIEGTSATLNSSLSIVNNEAGTGSPNIRLGKTRGTSIGSNTSVADGDNLGQIIFYGADGTDIYNATALIGAKVTGTVGTDTIPTDLVFETSATSGGGRDERLRISSDGRLLVNATVPRNVGGGVSRLIQVESSGGAAGISIVRNQNAATPPTLDLGKSRGYPHTIVQDDDKLGIVNFAGADGTDLQTPAAQIVCEVDGTPAENDMPGRLVFKTNNGTTFATERLQITSSGNIISNGGNTARIAWGTTGGTLYSGFSRYDGAAQDVGISHYATTNAGTSFVEHFRMEHNGTLKGTDTSIGSLSDIRLKKDIKDYSYDISKFKQFKPKSFNWINPEVHGDKSNVKGFIAQDIELVDKDWVEDSWIRDDDPDYDLVKETSTKNGLGEDVGISKISKFGYKDAMYISVIQQLISRIETLESS